MANKRKSQSERVREISRIKHDIRQEYQRLMNEVTTSTSLTELEDRLRELTGERTDHHSYVLFKSTRSISEKGKLKLTQRDRQFLNDIKVVVD